MQSEIPDDVVEAARVLNMKLHSATELGQRTQWIAEALLAERKAALSAAEPSVAVKAGHVEALIAEVHDAIDEYREGMKRTTFGPNEWPTVDGIKTTVAQALRRSALTAQVQDVAGWQPVEDVNPDHGDSFLGWVKICETFCAHPIYYSAFSRTWRRKLDGVKVDEVTHLMPLPAAPAKQEG